MPAWFKFFFKLRFPQSISGQTCKERFSVTNENKKLCTIWVKTIWWFEFILLQRCATFLIIRVRAALKVNFAAFSNFKAATITSKSPGALIFSLAFGYGILLFFFSRSEMNKLHANGRNNSQNYWDNNAGSCWCLQQQHLTGCANGRNI